MKKQLLLLLALMLTAFTFFSCALFEDEPDLEKPDSGTSDVGGGENGDNGTPTCTHSGGSATCTALAVCELCGKSYGETAPTAHSISDTWVTENGKHHKVCENGCDEIFEEGVCSSDADCFTSKPCTVCGADHINADAHTKSDKLSSADGTHFYLCANGCGEKFDVEDCTSVATCTTPGLCTVCGAGGGNIDPSNHKPAASYTYDNGTHYKVCEYGCESKLELGECSPTVASCVAGSACTVCTTVLGDPDPQAHDFDEAYTMENGTHYQICKNGCGTKKNEADCDGAATCTSKAKCSVCGKEHGDLDPTAHKISDKYTATESEHYKLCENGCGERFDSGAHSFGDWQTVSASDDKTSETAERTCAVCSHKQTHTYSAKVMPVKGGANGIVVFIHDDGDWNTALIADELYYNYGLVGDIAMQLNGGRVINSGDRYDLTDDVVQTNSILKWQTLFATNRWKLISHSMTHKWWGTYDISYTTNSEGKQVVDTCTNLAETMSLMEYEIVKSQAMLRYYFPGQRVLTFAHPGFAEPKNYIPGVTTALQKYDAVYNEAARELMEKYYIAARGGLGIVVDVNDPNGQWESNSKSSAYAEKTFSDVWNYFPAFGIDDNVTAHKSSVTKAATEGGLAVFYIHKLTKNESEKGNSNTMYAGNYEELLKHTSSYVNDGTVWNTFFEDAVLYLKEAETASLTMRTDANGYVYVTLTDGVSEFMLDENGNETTEQIYNYPLTVRINLPADWKAIKVEQNGSVSYAEAKTVDGIWVADAEIVPDAGEAKVTPASVDDIPVEEKKPILGTETVEYDTLYDFEDGISSVTSSYQTESTASTAQVTENGNNWLKISKAESVKGKGTPTWILNGSYLPTSASTMTVSFKIKVDRALLEAGDWGNVSGNKRVLNINFGGSEPYLLTIYRSLTSSTNGDSGALYLADTASNYAESTFTNLVELAFDTEYEIRIEMRMDGVNPFLAEIYVNGTKVAESTKANGYTIGSVPTVEYVSFVAQGRAVFDILLDDVYIKTTAPTGKVTVDVYAEDFNGKNVSMSEGSNNIVDPTYGSPKDDDVVALNINKATTDNETHSWTMLGNSVTNATKFTFKFDVYISSESVAGSSSRLYQIHFGSSTPYILTIELASDKSGYVLKDMADANAVLNLVSISDTISFDEWHTIELVVTLDGEFGAMAYVDGETNGVVSRNYGRVADGDAVRTALDRIVLYAQKASGANIYFDNFYLSAEVNF